MFHCFVSAKWIGAVSRSKESVTGSIRGRSLWPLTHNELLLTRRAQSSVCQFLYSLCFFLGGEGGQGVTFEKFKGRPGPGLHNEGYRIHLLLLIDL